jgi:hypothetical protein
MLSYNDGYVFCSNCNLYRKKLGLWQKAMIWAEDKVWWYRVPVIGWFAWLFYRSLNNPELTSMRTNVLSIFDLGIHELGHFIFMFLGRFMHILGGSLFQCLFPILCMIGFLQKKAYFAASMCWCWLGYNLYDVSVYAADARARLLPLVGPGGLGDGSDEAYDAGHDWYQLLSRTNHLSSDLAIARGLRIAAALCFVTGLTLGVILMIRMIIGPKNKQAAEPEEPKQKGIYPDAPN